MMSLLRSLAGVGFPGLCYHSALPGMDNPSATAPVGVLDSGIGGLTVLREIRRLLPDEDFLYLADTAACPYGDRHPAEVTERAYAITRLLLSRGVKAVVVACNTATIAAIDTLRATFPVPFVGMEPAVKPAAAVTRSGTIGVLATGGSLNGEKFRRLADTHGGTIRVLTRACPGLVEHIEAGHDDRAETRALVASIISPLIEEGTDTLVLGCTHYPFLRPLIEAVAGPGIRVLDTGEAVARQLARVLEARRLLHTRGPGRETFLTTGDPDAFARSLDRRWPGAAAPAQVDLPA